MASRRNLLAVGEAFEFRVMSIVHSVFPDALLMHDLRLYSSFLKKETQIDVVAVTDSGVFVIEVKNWKNWIKGNYGDSEWSGLTSDRKVITVFNAYHQNFIHVRELRNALRNEGIRPVHFHNLVVLPDGTDIYSDCSEVVNLSSLPSEMRKRRDASTRIDTILYANSIRRITRGVSDETSV